MTTIVITGANRGLGLEFTRQYAADGAKIYALCRDPSSADELKEIKGDVQIVRADVTDSEALKSFAESLNGEAIDLVINNAGIYGGTHQSFGGIDYEAWEKTFRINTMGPVRVAEALFDNLTKADQPKLITISSLMGSIADASGGDIIYRSSKTAVNMAMHMVAAAANDNQVVVVNLHPGWVQTDMGGTQAPVKPADSIAGMRKVIDGLTMDDSGHFIDYKGQSIPW
ncbi:MAG: SDR family oxidoreductase [Pseudobdellovibrionaceae bacterium]